MINTENTENLIFYFGKGKEGFFSNANEVLIVIIFKNQYEIIYECVSLHLISFAYRTLFNLLIFIVMDFKRFDVRSTDITKSLCIYKRSRAYLNIQFRRLFIYRDEKL